MIPPCATSAIDFTEVTSQTHPDYEQALATCEACPVLDWCKNYSIRNDVAGMAAAMLPTQRDLVREMSGIKLPKPDFLARIKVEQITPELLHENLDYEIPDLPKVMIDLINHWAEEGEQATEIVARLPRVDVYGYPLDLGYGEARFTARTVSWCRSPEMRHRHAAG